MSNFDDDRNYSDVNPNDYLNKGMVSAVVTFFFAFNPQIFSFLFGPNPVDPPGIHSLANMVSDFALEIRWPFVVVSAGMTILQFYAYFYIRKCKASHRENPSQHPVDYNAQGTVADIHSRPTLPKPSPSVPASAQSSGTTSTSSDGDFGTSMLVAGVSGSALLGMAVGGSVAGALAGELLADGLQSEPSSSSNLECDPTPQDPHADTVNDCMSTPDSGGGTSDFSGSDSSSSGSTDW